MILKKGDEVKFEGDFGTTNGVVTGIVSQAIYDCLYSDGTRHRIYGGEMITISKRMTFKEAKAELKKLADGRYHVIYYEITEDDSGELEQECKVYIHGYSHSTAPTWEQALQGMRDQINPPPPVKVEVEAIEEL